MATETIYVCDACGTRDVGANASVEIGQEFPKIRREICSPCKHALFSDLTLCLDDEGVAWLKEAIDNRRSDFETGKLRREWNPT